MSERLRGEISHAVVLPYWEEEADLNMLVEYHWALLFDWSADPL